MERLKQRVFYFLCFSIIIFQKLYVFTHPPNKEQKDIL